MHEKEIGDVLRQLKTSEEGLTAHEAEVRLHREGYNELTAKNGVRRWKILVQQFASPLVAILVVALVISIFLNEYIDAIIIGSIVILNALLGFTLEYKAEKAIEALQKMASAKAKVLRNGKETRIESRLLVSGDIIFVEMGDIVPADARILEAHDLETQEASLTGESFPVQKSTEKLPLKTALAERNNCLYSSTTITKGRAKAVVMATGMKTEVGKIASLIKESAPGLTPLQQKLRELGKYLTIAVIVIALIVFGAGVLQGRDATEMFLTALALAVAAIPEGLPAVITISLALGVQRMVKRRALVRKLPAVETLGSVNVICTDKTGTLTHNEMTVTKVWASNQQYLFGGSGYDAKGEIFLNGTAIDPTLLNMLLKIGVHCNNAQFEWQGKKRNAIGDPTEAALLVSGEKGGIVRATLNRKEERIDEVPFTSERKMMTTIHRVDGKTMSYTKGAPEVVLNSCDKILIDGKITRLDPELKKTILRQNTLFAEEALRVLAFAYNENATKERAEKNMIFVGLQAMIDPPRKEAKEAVKRCQSAGIRTIMITGDQKATAEAIAKQLGMKGIAVTGEELDAMANLEQKIQDIDVFARVNPEHKMRIIDALQKRGYVVAMTGDGVNDAPALKKADIGVSMGITGTDVAKEASDMILTDDNFATIVNAVEEGRAIFDNIRKFVNYLLSSNLGEIVLIFLATILGMPLPITAIQLLWINLVTDGLPAVALGFDPAEEGIMKRKPRAAKENIVSKKLSENILVLGFLVGGLTLLLFWLYRDSSLIKAQTIAFTTIVVLEIVRLQVIRSEYKLSFFSNRYLVGAVLVSLGLQLVVLYTPLGKFFDVVPLHISDWLVIGGTGVALLVFNFMVRRVFFRKEK